MKEDKETLVPLFSVVVRDAVGFKSAVDNTLLSIDGELRLDTKNRLVLAKAHAIFKREPLIIPLENVKCMVELTSKHEKLISEKKAAVPAPAPKVVEAPVVNDRIKYVKDEFGKIVEVRG